MTVPSGLVLGIDTLPMRSAQVGGRTIAVIGSGLRRIYPSVNVPLVERIAEQGAVVSQFWPDTPRRRRLERVLTGALRPGYAAIMGRAGRQALIQADVVI